MLQCGMLPIRLTNAARATVWKAVHNPWGEPYTLSVAKRLLSRRLSSAHRVPGCKLASAPHRFMTDALRSR